MRKRLAAAAVAGTLTLAGVGAIAIPALADPTPSAATEQGVVERIRQKLQSLVDDETITDAQADRVAQTLAEGRDGHHRGGGFGGGGGFGARGESLDAAATALGMNADDVRTAVRSGSTLAELAEQQDKDVDDVVTAIVEARKARIAEAVGDGRLTQEQADRFTEDLESRVRDMVENGRGRGGGFKGGPGSGPRGEAPTSPSPSTAPSASTSGAGFVA